MFPRPSGRRTSFFFCVLLAVSSLTVTAAVDHPRDRNRPESQAVFRFNVPAGPLEAALLAFQNTTAAKLAVPASLREVVPTLTSPGVTGTLTVERALRRLLNGTGLAFRLTGANTYTLNVAAVEESVDVTATTQETTALTAVKTLTPLRDVPQAVTVIPRGLIAEQRMQSMADVVRYVPGVGMGQGEGNRDTPILRGNSTTADFFIDGVRDDVQYFRDLYNVERVEALKGPNAMIFGRGGAGGVINRATRQADWNTTNEFVVQGGSHDNRRVTVDIDRPLNTAFAARFTGVYDNSDSYRQSVNIERYGVNPTFAAILGSATTIRAGFEHFHDERTADRGIPSSGSRPVATDVSTFFGDPTASEARVTVNALSVALDHRLPAGILLRNRTRFADYDKFYQNVYPASAVTANGTVSLSAYNNATARQNVFNQTDLNVDWRTGRVKHVVLAGLEFGRQATDNFRNTGYFTGIGPNVTSFSVPVTAPTVSVPMTFRQSATDADNDGVATVAAAYAQDQVELTRHLHAIGGIRFDRFHVDFHNNRTGANVAVTDNLVSPRVGLIVKPSEPWSIYTSYSLAYVPRAGEQLASLSLTNRSLDPERFINYEVGTKWDVRPALSVTAAVYRLDRTNVVVPDPNDASRSILVDGQRTSGVELSLSGRITAAWTATGGYAYQDGRIRATISASAMSGAKLAQVPSHAWSLWSRYAITPRVGAALGIIHNGDMFTSTDNTVLLPAFTRIDGALFVTLMGNLAAQLNLENLLDEHYYAFSNGNNNITPGAPRALRLTLTTRF